MIEVDIGLQELVTNKELKRIRDCNSELHFTSSVSGGVQKITVYLPETLTNSEVSTIIEDIAEQL